MLAIDVRDCHPRAPNDWIGIQPPLALMVTPRLTRVGHFDPSAASTVQSKPEHLEGGAMGLLKGQGGPQIRIPRAGSRR